jgi:hypothetical protein
MLIRFVFRGPAEVKASRDAVWEMKKLPQLA